MLASLTSTLAPLALLACPVGMGLMMWMMGRNMKKQDAPGPVGPPSQPASVEVLREEQRRIAEQIEALDTPSSLSETAGSPR